MRERKERQGKRRNEREYKKGKNIEGLKRRERKRERNKEREEKGENEQREIL